MSKWSCSYPGVHDSVSSGGIAAPSWHTFDRREWVRNGFTIELRNLYNEERLRSPQGRIMYQATLTDPNSVVLETKTGSCWQTLVKKAKGSKLI